MSVGVLARGPAARSARVATPRDEGWWSSAACAGLAPAMDTTNRQEARHLIDTWCQRCPVTIECGAEARTIHAGRGSYHGIPEGVWGGHLWRRGKPIRRTV